MAQIRSLRRVARRQFLQAEAVAGIYASLRPTAPLPSMSGWAASPELIARLISLIGEVEPSLILEAGSGVSTLAAGYCLKNRQQGKVIALEHDMAFAAETAREIARHQLQAYAEVRHSPLTQLSIDGRQWSWYDIGSIVDVEMIDLLVVDGPPGSVQKRARYPIVPLLIDRLSPRAAIILDDASRRDERQIVRAWTEEFPFLESQLLNTEKGISVIRRAAGQT